MTGSNRRMGPIAWLALFALGLQLALSFAHHHDKATPSLSEPATPGCAVASGAGCESNVGRASQSDDAPGRDHEDADCAICWAHAVSHAVIVGILLGIVEFICRLTPALPLHSVLRPRRRRSFAFSARGPPGGHPATIG